MKTVTKMMMSAMTLSLLAGAASAQCATFQKLNKASPSVNDHYGVSVALGTGLTSPLVVIGDPNYVGPGGAGVGSFSVWGQGSSWSSSGGSFGPTGGDHLGSAVDIGYPYVIAGAPGYLSGQGRARVYRTTNNGSSWVFEGDLLANFPNSTDQAGAAVAVSPYGGGWAVVGAPNHDFHGLSDPGAAFFFTRGANGTWSHAFQIWGGDFSGDNSEHRGTSVAMSKTSRYAVVGGPGGNATGQPAESGVAYVVSYLDNGLVGSPATINPPTGEAGAHFGQAVAVEGDVIAIAAPNSNVGVLFSTLTDAGRVYVYERSGFNWNLVAQLTASDAATNLHFGSTLATDGNRIAVGADGTKSVYVFEKIGGVWTQTSKLTDPDNPGTFGNSVSILGNNVAVGDWSDDEGGVTDRGAAYMFRLAQGQPSDVCSNAQPMPLTEFQACTEYATAGGNVSDCGTAAPQGPDIWYDFTPTCSGNAIIDTFGSDFDTVLSVHTGCPNFLNNNVLTCNDDASFPAPNNRASLVTFNFVQGETYHVRIAGYNGAKGVVNVRPSFYYSYANDVCSGALPVTEGSHTFGNCGAHTENGTIMCPADAFAARNDLWYSFTPSQSGTYTFGTCGSSIDSVMAIYAGCPGANTLPIACDDDFGSPCGGTAAGFSVTLNAGTDYRVRVGSFGEGNTGSFNLDIAFVPPCDPDLNQDGNVDQDDVAYLVNVIGGGANPSNIDPDINHDGNADQDDIAALINVVAGGACP